MTQNHVDIVAVVEFIIKAFRDFDDLRRVTILDNDEMVRLKEWPPHLQEVEVPDCGDHNVKLIFQQWRWGNRRGFSGGHWHKNQRERSERSEERIVRDEELVCGGYK